MVEIPVTSFEIVFSLLLYTGRRRVCESQLFFPWKSKYFRCLEFKIVRGLPGSDRIAKPGNFPEEQKKNYLAPTLWKLHIIIQLGFYILKKNKEKC